ncbi:Kinase-like protein [Pleurostoma richardsiae]|uniref:Kinase-like protein n=1 Tax=Pleurostoma richardsiae TaxID=41990 RepID=A0AA38RSK5_9PEZI|nr:Kinase-like protein [Pleurostoma richardsiae]
MGELPVIRLPDGSTFDTGPIDRSGEILPPRNEWQEPKLQHFDIAENEGNIATAIEQHLRNVRVKHPDQGRKFWPQKIFDDVLRRSIVERLVDELVRTGELLESGTDPQASKVRWVDEICGDKICIDKSGFRRVVAILLLMGKSNDISAFVEKRITDSRLPLDEADFRSPVGKPNGTELFQIPGWTARDIDSFLMYQRDLVVKFLEPPTTDGVRHYEFSAEEIRPWVTLPKRKSSSSSTAETRLGGYGEVHEISIHPWQHNFDDLLTSLLKLPDSGRGILDRDVEFEENAFQQEAHMLKRFGAKRPHIVTLLATIAYEKGLSGKQYCLLFPWAENDLLGFWKQTPTRDYRSYKWIAEQCWGLVDAVAYIHDSGLKNESGDRLFGQHGDIKPENILWYKLGGKEILVLSDLGIAEVHREISRSTQKPIKIVSWDYRPPERDMEAPDGIGTDALGTVSRAFDIWTLGCVFLEFTVWALDGPEGVECFKEKRKSSYEDGAPTTGTVHTRIFFDGVFSKSNPDLFTFKIKTGVKECFDRLHDNKQCTQYIHDFLDLIQAHMMLVDQKKRIKSKELLKRIEELKQNCKDRGYCLTPCPRKSTYHEPPPIKSRLNSQARESLEPK